MQSHTIKKLLNYEFKHVLPSHRNLVIDKGKEKLEELVKGVKNLLEEGERREEGPRSD